MITGPNPCYECGKDVKQPRLFVHPYDGGAKYVMQGEDENQLAIDEAGDMGWHPVGSCCARKLRKQGILVFEEKKP
jgi:hypothetical protein